MCVIRWLLSLVLSGVFSYCTALDIDNTHEATNNQECGHNYPDVLYTCPEQGDYPFRDVLHDIMAQGKWTNVFIMTNSWELLAPIRHNDATQISATQMSCGAPPAQVAQTINRTSHKLGEYHNILSDCDVTDIVDVLGELRDGSSGEFLNFNLLLLNVSTDNFPLLKTHLQDGDNVVMATIDYVRNGRYTKQAAFVHLSWCLTDCYKQTSIASLGRYANDVTLPITASLLPATFEQFYGRELIVAYQDERPFTYTVVEDGIPTVKGLEVEIHNELATLFNFSLKYVKPDEYAWGKQLNSTYWNGMIGMVHRWEADLAGSSMTVGIAREEVIDFLYPHWEDSSIIAVKLSFSKWTYFVSVYATDSWLAICALPAFTALVLGIWFTVQEHVQRDQQETKTVQNIKDNALHLPYYALICFGNVVYQGCAIKRLRGSARFVSGGLWLTVIILVAVYVGNLTATLAVRNVKLPFNTLNELAEDTEYIFVIQKDTFKEQLFRDAESGIYKRLWAKVNQYPEEALVQQMKIKFQEVLAYTGPKKYVFTAGKLAFKEIMRQSSACDVTMLREEYLKGGAALVVKQGVPYWEPFSAAIMRMQAGGLINKWASDHLSRDICQAQDLTQMEPVRLGDLTYVCLFVLGAGLGAGLVGLGAEVLVTAGRHWWQDWSSQPTEETTALYL